MFSKSWFIWFALPILHGGYSQTTNARTKQEPCQLSNLKCIRDSLAARSTCDKYRVWGSIPDETIRYDVYYESPFFSSTLRDQYVRISGLRNCKVGAYYTNKDSNATILGIECPDVFIEAHRSVKRHYPFKEDERHSYIITGRYDVIRLTINLLDPNNLDICSESAYAVSESLPDVEITPDDRATEEFLSRKENSIINNLAIYVREVSISRAVDMFRYIVNNLLCNYDCEHNRSEMLAVE